MLRERPELFYPQFYYAAPQHWQASSYPFAQHQLTSQQYFTSGYVVINLVTYIYMFTTTLSLLVHFKTL